MPIQSSLRYTLLALSVVPVFGLAACGDAGGGASHNTYWEGVPYTHERTAGKGVAFVRGAMMPPKETKTEAVMEAPAPAVAEPAVVEPEPSLEPPIEAPTTSGDRIFDSRQGK